MSNIENVLIFIKLIATEKNKNNRYHNIQDEGIQFRQEFLFTSELKMLGFAECSLKQF